MGAVVEPVQASQYLNDVELANLRYGHSVVLGTFGDNPSESAVMNIRASGTSRSVNSSEKSGNKDKTSS